MSNEELNQRLKSLQEEIVELQSRLQFQDDFIHKLDDVVIKQGRLLDRFQQRLEMLEDRLAQLQYERGQPAAEQNEKPPHY